MKKILEAFARGDLLTENRSTENMSEYKRAINMLVDNEEKLKAILDEHGKEVLQKFSDATFDINDISCIDRFIYGYRLGVLMTIEVFAGENELIIGKGVQR